MNDEEIFKKRLSRFCDDMELALNAVNALWINAHKWVEVNFKDLSLEDRSMLKVKVVEWMIALIAR